MSAVLLIAFVIASIRKGAQNPHQPQSWPLRPMKVSAFQPLRHWQSPPVFKSFSNPL